MLIRRLQSYLFAFVMVFGLFGPAPSGTSAAQGERPGPALTPSSKPGFGELLVTFPLPAGGDPSGGPLAGETEEGGFEQIFARLLPFLQEWKANGRLADFRPDRQAYGLVLVGAEPSITGEIARVVAVDHSITLPNGLSVKVPSPLAERRSTVKHLQDIQLAAQKIGTRTDFQSETPLPTARAQERSDGSTRTVDRNSGNASGAFPSLTAGHFQVNMRSNYLSGITSTAGVDTVTVTLKRAGDTIATASTSSDLTGTYSTYIDLPNGDYLQFQPGDEITIAETDGSSYSWILPTLAAKYNSFTGRTITGVAPQNALVRVQVSRPSGYETNDLTAGADGSFSSTFSADFVRKYSTQISAVDPLSQNQVYVYMELYLSVWLNNYWNCMMAGSSGYTAQAVTFNLLSSAHLQEDTTAVYPSEIGWACAHFDTVAPAPGKFLQMVTPSGDTFEMQVPNLAAEPNPAANTVIGTAPAGRPVSVYLLHQQGGTFVQYHRDATAAVDGSYSVDFSASADMTGQDYGHVDYFDPANNYTTVEYSIPYIFVNTFSLYMGGYLSARNSNVIVNLKTAAGGLRGSWSTQTYSSGFFSISFYSPDQVWISPHAGDQIEVIPASGTPIFETFPALTFSADQAAGQISGQTLAGAAVNVHVCRVATTGEVCDLQTGAAATDGAYSISFAGGFGVQLGDQVTVDVVNSQGNKFTTAAYLPNRLSVNVVDQIVDIFTTVNTPVVLHVYDSDLTLKISATGTSNQWGELYLVSLGSLSAGDVVEVTAAGVTSQVPIVPLGFAIVDRAASRVTGKGPDSTIIGLQVHSGSAVYHPAYGKTFTTDSDGSFDQDLSASREFFRGDGIILTAQAAAGSQQVVYATVPGISMTAGSKSFYGSATPGSQMVGLLKTAGGDILDHCANLTESWGYWDCQFSVKPQSGDVLEIQTMGAVLNIGVPDLSITADPDTDIVTGRAPASAWIDLWITSTFDGRQGGLTSGVDGTFSWSPEPGFDITHLGNVQANYHNAKFDQFFMFYVVPGVLVRAGSYRQVEGYGPPDSSVNLTLSGGHSASAAVTSGSPEGHFSKYLFCNGSTPVDISAGDTLTASQAGQVNLSAVTGSVNLAADTVSGTAPANAQMMVYLYTENGFWTDGQLVSAGADGTFAADFSGIDDIVMGDYAEVLLDNSVGDRSIYTFRTTAPAGLSASITPVPTGARPKTPLSVAWKVTGGINQSTHLSWDTLSHACDREYAYSNDWFSGATGSYSSYLIAPAGGTIYLSAFALVDGNEVWSPEVAVPVSAITPVITDPVNGDTNSAAPVFKGQVDPSLSGQSAVLREGLPEGSSIVAGSGPVAADGTFAIALTAPAPDGAYTYFVSAGGLASNVVELTVNTALLVDPNHIFLTEDGYTFRINKLGYVRLGGRIWPRPAATISIRIPIACTPVSSVSVTAGTVTTALVDLGDGAWGGPFVHPGSNFAITANITCGADPVQHVLLTDGIIDPDGTITDSKTSEKLSGVEVTLQVYDPGSASYVPWDGATWGQDNPVVTGDNGYYRFFVPPGKYRLAVSLFHYHASLSDEITVVDAPVTVNLALQPWLQVLLPVLRK